MSYVTSPEKPGSAVETRCCNEPAIIGRCCSGLTLVISGVVLGHPVLGLGCRLESSAARRKVRARWLALSAGQLSRDEHRRVLFSIVPRFAVLFFFATDPSQKRNANGNGGNEQARADAEPGVGAAAHHVQILSSRGKSIGVEEDFWDACSSNGSVVVRATGRHSESFAVHDRELRPQGIPGRNVFQEQICGDTCPA